MPARRGPTASHFPKQEEPGRALEADDSLAAGSQFVWGALQVGAIALAACRIPLAAQYPIIAEFHACQLLAVVQLPLAAMLMPTLVRNWRSTIAAAALAGVLQFVAGSLTNASLSDSSPLAAYVVIWVGALHVLCLSAKNFKSLLALAGGLATFVGGAPILIYLGSDISGRSSARFLGGPLLLILRSWPSVAIGAWIWLGIILVAGRGFRLFFQTFFAHRARAAG
jgi:hypothetical protein